MITDCRNTFSFVELRYSRNDDNSSEHRDECNYNEACVITSV